MQKTEEVYSEINILEEKNDILEKKYIKLRAAVKEREKELEGVYSLGLLTDKYPNKFDMICKEFVNKVLPQSMQFPEKVYVLLEIENKTYTNYKNFDILDEEKAISQKISVGNKELGKLVVAYIDESSFIDDFEPRVIQYYAERLAKISLSIKTSLKLKLKNKELQEANATKDRFFSIIAHDLRNPFSAMVGFSDMLNDNYDSYNDEERKEFISDLQKSISITHKLLDNLLFWASTQQGKIKFKPRKTTINFLFKQAVDISQQAIKNKDLNIFIDLKEEVPLIADEQMILTILRNLISNAVKFTPRNGTIILRAEKVNNRIKVIVEDTGIGISEEIRAKLFDLQNSISIRGTENEKGTGLGLILCKEFVKKHKGDIWVESQLGKGSSFCFFIPQNI